MALLTKEAAVAVSWHTYQSLISLVQGNSAAYLSVTSFGTDSFREIFNYSNFHFCFRKKGE